MSSPEHKHSCCHGIGVGGVHALLDEFNRIKEEQEKQRKQQQEKEITYEIEGNRCLCRQKE